MDLSGFTSLLDRAFLEYRIRQTRQRLSVSLNSFAGFLDFSPPIVNMWLSGSRLPSQGNVERLIPKLVELLDLEVYDILGLPRPDPNLLRLTKAWSRIPVQFQQLLAEQAEKYAAEEENAPAGREKSIGEGENAAVQAEKSATDGENATVQGEKTVANRVNAAVQAEKSVADGENAAVQGKISAEGIDVGIEGQKNKLKEDGDLVQDG